jgi:hypothetical protein
LHLADTLRQVRVAQHGGKNEVFGGQVGGQSRDDHDQENRYCLRASDRRVRLIVQQALA